MVISRECRFPHAAGGGGSKNKSPYKFVYFSNDIESIFKYSGTINMKKLMN